VRRLRNGRYEVTSADGSKVVVDKVILATGFRSRLESILAPVVTRAPDDKELGPENPVTSSSAVVNIDGEVGTQERGKGRRVIIGQMLRRVRGKFVPIYFSGAAVGDIVPREELKGVFENKKSIFALGPRTAALARLLAERIKPLPVAEPREPLTTLRPNGTTRTLTIDTPGLTFSRDVAPLTDLLAEAKLMAAIRREIKLDSTLPDIRLKISAGPGTKLLVQFSQAVDLVGASVVQFALESKPELLSSLRTIVDGGGLVDAPRYEIDLKLSRGAYGRIADSELVVSKAPVVTAVDRARTRVVSKPESTRTRGLTGAVSDERLRGVLDRVRRARERVRFR
jgi:hypothetical protein